MGPRVAVAGGEHGYAAIAASQQAMADMGARRSRLVFWLYRHLARQAGATPAGRVSGA